MRRACVLERAAGSGGQIEISRNNGLPFAPGAVAATFMFRARHFGHCVIRSATVV
jgi:hypothetical protein